MTQKERTRARRALERLGRDSEKSIEARLVSGVRRRGGLCLKYSNPAEGGYPDRLVILPGAEICFVELKSGGGKPRPLQASRINALRALGADAFVCGSRADVDALLRAYDGRGEDAP